MAGEHGRAGGAGEPDPRKRRGAEYQEEQLHSLASYAAKAVSEKIMKGIAFFLTLVLAVGFVTIAVKIVELIAEIPGISF